MSLFSLDIGFRWPGRIENPKSSEIRNPKIRFDPSSDSFMMMLQLFKALSQNWVSVEITQFLRIFLQHSQIIDQKNLLQPLLDHK